MVEWSAFVADLFIVLGYHGGLPLRRLGVGVCLCGGWRFLSAFVAAGSMPLRRCILSLVELQGVGSFVVYNW